MPMFTPELTHRDNGTYILLANHAVEDAKSLRLSIDFNLARIRYGSAHLPKGIDKCILVYDIRGQKVGAETIETLEAAFAQIHELRVMR